MRRRWSGEGTGNGFTSAAAAPLPSELRLAPYRRRGGASRGRGRAPPPLNPYSCRRHRARHRPLRGTEDSRKREGQRRRRRKPGNAHCAGARRQRTRRGGEGGAVHCAHARPRRDVLGADCPAGGGGGGWIVSAHACGGGRRAAPSTLGLRACGREVAYIQCVSPPPAAVAGRFSLRFFRESPFEDKIGLVGSRGNALEGAGPADREASASCSPGRARGREGGLRATACPKPPCYCIPLGSRHPRDSPASIPLESSSPAASQRQHIYLHL